MRAIHRLAGLLWLAFLIASPWACSEPRRQSLLPPATFTSSISSDSSDAGVLGSGLDTAAAGTTTVQQVEGLASESRDYADARKAEPAKPGSLPGVGNFAKVSDVLYRGAQPTAEGFAQLKKIGIRTVINLRAFHCDRPLLAGLGLRYLRISCKAWHPEDEDTVKFLKAVTDPVNQPVFVHCWHGADRTGVAVAVYRMVVEGWSNEDAVAEMHAFGFHKVWRGLEKYVLSFNAAAMKKKIEKEPPPPVEVVP